MTNINADTINNSVIFQEQKPNLKSEDTIFHYYTTNTNSVESIQEDNQHSDTPENVREAYEIKALERLIYNFIRDGNTREVKELLEQYKNYSSPIIEKWKKAFSHKFKTKKGRASLRSDEIENESRWIREYGEKFISKWVALQNGDLIASSDTFENLKEEIEQIQKRNNVTFLKL